MRINATKLRASIYRVLDEAIETGKPIHVQRKGRLLKIEPEEGSSKLSRLKKHRIMKEDPETYVSTDWSSDWNRDLP